MSDWGRFDTPKATLLLTVSYERHSGGKRIQSQHEPHAWAAPKIFLLLPPTTVLSGSSVGEGAGVRSVQIASQGEDSQFLRYTTNVKQNRTCSAEEACER